MREGNPRARFVLTDVTTGERLPRYEDLLEELARLKAELAKR